MNTGINDNSFHRCYKLVWLLSESLACSPFRKTQNRICFFLTKLEERNILRKKKRSRNKNGNRYRNKLFRLSTVSVGLFSILRRRYPSDDNCPTLLRFPQVRQCHSEGKACHCLSLHSSQRGRDGKKSPLIGRAYIQRGAARGRRCK